MSVRSCEMSRCDSICDVAYCWFCVVKAVSSALSLVSSSTFSASSASRRSLVAAMPWFSAMYQRTIATLACCSASFAAALLIVSMNSSRFATDCARNDSS